MRALLPLIIFTVACSASDKVADDASSGDSGMLASERCLDEPMALTMGTGEHQFKPLVPGGRIEVIHGTQDGHHILGSLRIQNITDVAMIRYTITTSATGKRISDQIYRIRLTEYEEGGDCAWQALGLYAYLGRIDPGTATFLMEQNVMEMTVTNTAGEFASTSIEIYPFVESVDHGSDTADPRGE